MYFSWTLKSQWPDYLCTLIIVTLLSSDLSSKYQSNLQLLISGQSTRTTYSTDRGSHLNMLVQPHQHNQPMESVLMCTVTTSVTGTQVLCVEDRGSIQWILWPQASTIASLYYRYLWECSLFSSCFAHDITWRARQLVHAGDDSKHWRALRDFMWRDPDVRIFFTGTYSPWRACHDTFLLTMSLSTLKEIIVSRQCSGGVSQWCQIHKGY